MGRLNLMAISCGSIPKVSLNRERSDRMTDQLKPIREGLEGNVLKDSLISAYFYTKTIVFIF